MISLAISRRVLPLISSGKLNLLGYYQQKCYLSSKRVNSDKAEEHLNTHTEEKPHTAKVVGFWQNGGILRKGFIILLAVGAVLYYVRMYIKIKYNKELVEQLKSGGKAYGSMNVGGSFELVNTKGEKITNTSFLGKWVVMYFGFTYCPDICPEQMEAMGEMVDRAEKELGLSNMIPVMVTIDTERDTPEIIDEYLSDYHPKFVGLLGEEKNIDMMCKKFRVYRSKGQALSDPNDYILDHTVTQYLIDPDGNVVGYFMRNRDMDSRLATLGDKVEEYVRLKNESSKSVMLRLWDAVMPAKT